MRRKAASSIPISMTSWRREGGYRRKRTLRLTAHARADLAEIASYLISEASEEIARGIVSSILSRLGTLRNFPRSGARRDHIRPGRRIVVSQNYVVYYRATETEIIALRVLHGSRDVEAIAARGGLDP